MGIYPSPDLVFYTAMKSQTGKSDINSPQRA